MKLKNQRRGKGRKERNKRRKDCLVTKVLWTSEYELRTALMCYRQMLTKAEQEWASKPPLLLLPCWDGYFPATPKITKWFHVKWDQHLKSCIQASFSPLMTPKVCISKKALKRPTQNLEWCNMPKAGIMPKAEEKHKEVRGPKQEHQSIPHPSDHDLLATG